MSIKRLTRLLLSLTLIASFIGVGNVIVSAQDEVDGRGHYNPRDKGKKRKKKDCDRRDRSAGYEDEERGYGHCSGTVPTPEPVSILLFSAGLAGVGFAARRRLRKSEGEME